ncbi:NTE family protein RssA [Aquicella siphonis]|uniref:NTE family protein RssA n=1 Tax=Aquicella siphonis TaxID=254247 RepID=A0A5E4PHW1_9COXI|nr:patatin-like phospholipase family protein [Aquicella siphonis]VVC75916.1 NTE family protein RssA [Aquicella siphonis]
MTITINVMNIKRQVNVLYVILLVPLFIFLTACAARQPVIDIPQTPPPVKKINRPPRVALVLGSGGVRGYAHLGVLQALEEAHIPVDVIVGCSAGSIVASLYADNQSFRKTYDIMMPAGFWDYADISNLTSGGGIVAGYQLETFLLQHMKARSFGELNTKVIIATTDVHSGKLYPIESGPIAPAVLASSAIPGAIKPVQIYGRALIDGGVISPVPVELASKLHPRLIIAVNLSTKSSQPALNSALDVLDSAMYIMGKRITDDSLKAADVVISPKVGDVNIFDIRRKKELYLAGLSAARKQIPAIRRLLAQTDKARH